MVDTDELAVGDELFEDLIIDPRPVADYPEMLIIDWSDFCNLKCFFCGRGDYEKTINGRGGFIALNKLKNLKKQIMAAKYLMFSSGIGEPLLHPELKDILDWIYDINPSLKLRIVTNGTALFKERADWFANRLDWLSISLNASNATSYIRDMYPHEFEQGSDGIKRWEYLLRRLSDFIGALPENDRPKVRIQNVTHAANIKDMTEFVDVAVRIGCKHAVFSAINIHKVEDISYSLYAVKDEYNCAADQAVSYGCKLGIRVDAARFYCSLKPVINLDEACRDPIDNAYLTLGDSGTPCCHWTEAPIPRDLYGDTSGFDKFWNHDLLVSLRKKRDYDSCKVCGMTRIFDELSFHFSPLLKQHIIKGEAGISSLLTEGEYADEEIVKSCLKHRLDLPSLRYTLNFFGLPIKQLDNLLNDNLKTFLAYIDNECWEKFKKLDIETIEFDIFPSGNVLGVGWGAPIYEPHNLRSGRWISSIQQASLFLRVQGGCDTKIIVQIHHIHPTRSISSIGIFVADQLFRPEIIEDKNGTLIIAAIIPNRLIDLYEGRLWLKIGCFDDCNDAILQHFSIMSLSLHRINP